MFSRKRACLALKRGARFGPGLGGAIAHELDVPGVEVVVADAVRRGSLALAHALDGDVHLGQPAVDVVEQLQDGPFADRALPGAVGFVDAVEAPAQLGFGVVDLL